MSNRGRSEEILYIVNSEGSVSIHELAKRVFASPSTVRRDLEVLERQGLLRRHHGGAESVLSFNPTQSIRRRRNRAEKNAIAAKAAALVSRGNTIFIDSSTTAQYMIPYLSDVEQLTVYTNGADTAMRLAEAGVRVVSTGGELFAESMAYVGRIAEDALRKVYFDAMFFSSAGFDAHFISDWSEHETALRRTAIEQSGKKYFLADISKRDKRYTHIVCSVSSIDKIICE